MTNQNELYLGAFIRYLTIAYCLSFLLVSLAAVFDAPLIILSMAMYFTPFLVMYFACAHAYIHYQCSSKAWLGHLPVVVLMIAMGLCYALLLRWFYDYPPINILVVGILQYIFMCFGALSQHFWQLKHQKKAHKQMHKPRKPF